MLKLMYYLKPYLIMCIVSLSFLFIQVMTGLSLPNYLSKIVDDGLQKGGIVSSIPQAISVQGMQFLQTFMSEQNIQRVNASYTHLDEIIDTNYAQDIQKKFPKIHTIDSVVLKNDNDTIEVLEDIFSHSIYTYVLVSSTLPKDKKDTMANTEAGLRIDVQSLYDELPLFDSIPSEEFDIALENSKIANKNKLNQTFPPFIKGFYTELGCDITKIQMNSIYKNGAIMLILSLANITAAICVVFLASYIGAAVAKDLRHDVFKRIMSFSNNELDKFGTASLITRTTNDVTQVQSLVVMGLRMICFAPTMAIGSIIMAFSTSVSLTWIIALSVMVLISTMMGILSLVLPRIVLMQKLIDRLNLIIRENLGGMLVIRAFGNQQFEQKRFDTSNNDLIKNSLFTNRMMMFMHPCVTFIMNATMLLIVWFGAKQIAQSNLEVGAMMAFMQYVMKVIMSFMMITRIFVTIPRASISGERIYKVLSTQKSIHDKENPQNFDDEVIGNIEFKNVCFRYEGASENVLENISFTAKAGQTTAFIGSTGSGKSTLINLIPRFYDITSGSITIDGIDIRNIKQRVLRDKIGYVPQQSILCSGNIESNLRYGDENANNEQMSEACSVAQASDFIHDSPHKFESEISQGGKNISGGQRQRLSIARALIKKAPINIFDDSFSALDFKTDAKLRRALFEKMKETSILVVAQRINTVIYAEKIIVLSHGRIVGTGTHKELLKTCETYKEIAYSQLSQEELENE